MFGPWPGQPRDETAYATARRLRSELGMPFKRIATSVGISVATAHLWTRDIEITAEQHGRNLGRGMTADREVVARRARGWATTSRRKRAQWQAEGRQRAMEMDPLHMAGCMLYWAEGSKSRNSAQLSNSDIHLVRFFKRFASECFAIADDGFSVRLNVYTGNGLSVHEIETHWLDALELPRNCLRKHTLNHFPTSSSGGKWNKLPYGVCALRVLRSTHIVQHIYGAIQQYAGFDEPRWLNALRS